MAELSRAMAAAALEQARLGEAELDRLRRRMVWTLFAVSALGSTGYIAAVTVGTLAAADIAGGPTLGGVPTAASTFGTAGAASLLSALMLRVGRRPSVLVGLAVGVIGAVVAVIGVVLASIPILLAGSAIAGFANATGNLGRYIAGDLMPPQRRASALGTVVWGATVGSVIGPNLVSPAGEVATALGLPELAGAYVITAVFIGLALLLAALLLRPEPYALADPSALTSGPTDEPAPALSTSFARPSVLLALVTLVAGQVVMVLIMTMTPIHLIDHGHGLSTVGLVLSAHTFGMFALSPISGRLTDRLGSLAVIGAGLAVLGFAALLAALAPADGGLLLTLALFLLGFGWNLGFVAGSSLLTRGLTLAERTRVQGVTDGLVWSSAAFASLISGVVVAGASYTALGLLGLGLLVPPAVLLLARRSAATWTT